MAIKHAKASAKADGADASLVQPSDWNADHLLRWRVATVGGPLWESDPVVAVVSAQTTFALPDPAVVGADFRIKNSSTSTASVLVQPSSDGLIYISPTVALLPADRFVLRPGESAHIVARTSFDYELIARYASPVLVSVTVSPAANFEAVRTVSDPAIRPGLQVSSWLTPNADWDADDLAGYTVTATPGTGSIDFLISGPGPIGGAFDIAYTWR